KYYFSFNKVTQKEKTISPEVLDADQSHFRLLLFLLGMVAMISQVIYIREFISVLSGNELVVGIVMAAWMLLTGWGALFARKGNFSGFSLKRGISMLAALSIFPLVLIALLYLLKNLMFPPGTLINIGNSVVAAFILLFPVCFLSGYLFTVFSTFYSTAGNTNLTGKSYAIESLGSLVGGVLFSLILGRFFNSFQVFGISAAIVFFAGAWMIRSKNSGPDWKLVSAGVLLPALIFIFNPDNFIKKISYPNQELVSNQSTRYGNLVVSRQAGQINVYEDNSLQFYTENSMMNEEAVHFPMVQHQNPRQVLLISGGIAGMITEILKYEVDKITYLETNPEIFRLLREFTGSLPDSGKVEILKKDIRSFISRTGRKYDVILINLPPPASLGLNRFYTEEFFRLLKNHCDHETVICTSLPSTANYAEKNALDANSSLWKTLGLYFENRLLMTGEKNYFLASDAPLTSAITRKIAEKNIPTDYVNQYYLDDGLLSMRNETITSRFDNSVPVNRDFYPYIFVKQISHWLSHFGTGYRLMIILPAALFLLLFLRTNRITAGLYTGGFTASSLEVTLLLAYQVYFGSIYLSTALFFAVFMGGLALGSSLKYENKIPAIRSYYLLQFGLAFFAAILPFLIQLRGPVAAWLVLGQMLFFVLTFILATGIGFEFLLASKLQQKSYSETSGINYSTDLAGSAFGAYLTAIVLLPLLGLFKTCMLVAVLNIVSGVMAFSGRKSYVFAR
ncbi:MAG: hypothetical protein IH594_00505, partial [Bacteroidales bacterium]|nr:hypothetical protein [Bacteroidales bacterium]